MLPNSIRPGPSEELCPGIEGIVYLTIAAKVAAVQAMLQVLDADAERVRRLTRWCWITDARHRLPRENAV